MEMSVRLVDLPAMHPRLLWTDIAAAAAAVLNDAATPPPFLFAMAMQDVPGFAGDALHLRIDPGGISESYVSRLRRTYDASRLIELAAIAIAGLTLYHGGGHEIRDVALRGSAADYLVDGANHVLEVGGRSRLGDFGSAWQQKWRTLSDRLSGGFYLCVAEFETPAGRLAFRD